MAGSADLTSTVMVNGEAPPLDYEVVVIGAGMCGVYQIHRLSERGIKATVLEASDGIGGNWWANRYPGCRFDSESYSYGYSFSQQVLDAWNWSELFAPQPETLEYINFVVDQFDLRKHIQTGCRVQAASFSEAERTWTLRISDGRTITTRFVLTAIGLLTIPIIPRFDHIDSFQGPAFHTHDWPHEGIDLTDKRVAVIGTGSSGVQTISAIASQVATLTIFQRNPHWCAPLHNRPIDAAEMARIRASYADIFERCRQTPGAFVHGPDPRKTLELTQEERVAFWEELYGAPGFGISLGNFRDTGMNEEANKLLSAYIADKIRDRVRDPETAEKLIPRDHGFGTKRVVLETGYYEVYNRPNVSLVDLKTTPIERLTEKGIRTSDREHEFDVIVFATGYDAITGAFDRIDFSGSGGLKLRDKWAQGPVTYLGIQTVGFPNLFTLSGPQSGSGSTNFPRGIEEICDWTTDFLEYVRMNGYTRVEPKPEAEKWWFAHVKERANMVLLTNTKSWWTGHNTNLDRGDEPRYMMYTGGSVRYRGFLVEQVDEGYPGFVLS